MVCSSLMVEVGVRRRCHRAEFEVGDGPAAHPVDGSDVTIGEVRDQGGRVLDDENGVVQKSLAGAAFALRRSGPPSWWRPIYSRRAGHLWPPPPPLTFTYVVPAGYREDPPWEQPLPGGDRVLVTTRHLRRVGSEGLTPPAASPERRCAVKT